MTAKDAARTSIKSTLDQLKQLLSNAKPPKLSESDTKANFIDKYIDALGYKGLAEITREYYVKNSQEFIDYVLRSGDKPLLAIEAKALQIELTDKAAAQLVQYCAVEGIEWCVLTNGWKLHLYNQYLKGGLDAKLLFKLDLLAYNTDEEFDAIFEQLWLLSKESMTTPSGIKTWVEHQQLDKAMRSLLLDPTSAPVKYLRRTLQEHSLYVSAEIVAQWFRTQLTSPVTALLPEQVVPKATKPTILHQTSASLATGTITTGDASARTYWVLPAGNRKDATALEWLEAMLNRGMWGMNESTAGRKHLKQGDRVCFYAAKVGVVATATIAGPANQLLSPDAMPIPPDTSQPLYRVPLSDVRWLPQPIPIDETLRSHLDAFQNHPPSAIWSWFIQSTSKVTEHDFRLLTGQLFEAAG